MIFCGNDIMPGERKKISIPVPSAPSLNAVYLCGADPGPTLVVTAGVHGCEYVGIQALYGLAEELDPAVMSGNVILLPLVNPSGFYAGAKQVVPEDGINLNRAFPGNINGSLSARLAAVLEQTLYPVADFLADLHSGDCNEALHPLVFFPVSGEETVNRIALEAAKTLTVPYRVCSAAKNGLYSWAVQKGIPALLIERGGEGVWSEREVAACREDICSLLRHLKILPGENPPREQVEIVEAVYEEAKANGFWYPSVKTDTPVQKGELLGRLEDEEGRLIQEIHAAFTGVPLYYTTALGVRAGDSLIAYGAQT